MIDFLNHTCTLEVLSRNPSHVVTETSPISYSFLHPSHQLPFILSWHLPFLGQFRVLLKWDHPLILALSLPFFYIHPPALPYCSCHTSASNFPLKWALQSLSSLPLLHPCPQCHPLPTQFPKSTATLSSTCFTQKSKSFCLPSKASLKPVSIIQLATYQSQCSQETDLLSSLPILLSFFLPSLSQKPIHFQMEALKKRTILSTFMTSYTISSCSVLRAPTQWNQIIPEGLSCGENVLYHLFNVEAWSVWEWVWTNSTWFQATQWTI